MSRKKKIRAPRNQPKRKNKVVEALQAVSGELNGINERLDTVQGEVSTLAESVKQLPTQVTESISLDGVSQTTTRSAPNTDALDELVKTQQKEAAKKLREEVLPQARSAQRFYGYLTISKNGGKFEMEKVEGVARLEEILEGIEDGTVRVLMNPFAATPETQPARDEAGDDDLPQTKLETPKKRGLLSRLLGN